MTDNQSDKPQIEAPEEPPAEVIPGGGDGGDEARMVLPTNPAVMAIRNTVIFPGTVMPLVVGRDKSRRLIDDVLPDQRTIILLAQREGDVEDPAPEDLFEMGTAVTVLKLLRNEDGNRTIIVHGLLRVHIDAFSQTDPYFRAAVTPVEDVLDPAAGRETEARVMDVRAKADRLVELAPNVPDEAQVVINSIESPSALADFLAANLPLELPAKQSLLDEPNVLHRLEILQQYLHHQVDVLELSGQIQQEVRQSIDKSQREYFLREQLKAIQKELGQVDEQTAEVQELKDKIDKTEMSDPVKTECLRQVDRLERIPPASPEYNVIRTYVDVMVELPWGVTTPDELDINRARKILDADHYDLEKVKKRILEYLAVRRLAPGSRGPVLCFVGPPGVGKTSLGQSIARALGRKFIRMSLGGMRDEAELRGHRRTYIGAMPGRVIQEIRKAGTSNPVFMLDELDKVGMDFRGDPTSALLEILDPAQNFSFQDHYLNVPFDLSKVMFIGTANVMDTVPPALRDRMEVIEIPGYTRSEKLHIARKYLLPRQLKENGLKATQLKITDAALGHITAYHTREAGVRELERRIGAICRAMAARIAEGKARRKTVNVKDVSGFLGPKEYESELAQRTSVPGVATGLAYTPYGGEIIFIEATAYPGKGNLVLTGQIGDVMRESARAALSLVRSRGGEMGIPDEKFANQDIHMHVPAGAIPKDGPSAGVAMATAICSLLTGTSVHSDVAMTGEVTLRGLVLPVGGIKEKVLAARQAGIRTVVLPERNRRHIEDVPDEARKKMKFIFADNIEQVLNAAIDGEVVRPARPVRKRRSKAKAKGDS